MKPLHDREEEQEGGDTNKLAAVNLPTDAQILGRMGKVRPVFFS